MEQAAKIRERALEIWRETPARQGCEVRLRSEGFPPDAVACVVAELYEQRKSLLKNLSTQHESLVMQLSKMLAGELPSAGVSIADLAGVARDKQKSLAIENLFYRRRLVVSIGALVLAVLLSAAYIAINFAQTVFSVEHALLCCLAPA